MRNNETTPKKNQNCRLLEKRSSSVRLYCSGEIGYVRHNRIPGSHTQLYAIEGSVGATAANAGSVRPVSGQCVKRAADQTAQPEQVVNRRNPCPSRRGRNCHRVALPPDCGTQRNWACRV